MRSRDRILVAYAALVIAVVRVALLILPFATVRHLAVSVPGPSHADRRAIVRVPRAVRTAARRLPGARCLAQALAAQILLRRAGVQAEVRVGLARGRDGRVEGHAWVEHGGRVLIGGRDTDRFTLVAALAEERGAP